MDVSDRVYFKSVTASGKPYISAGLIGRKLRQRIIVIAVPTRDAAGRPTGMLTGAIRLTTLARAKRTQPLGIDGLTIVDREGQLLLSGLARTTNPAMLSRIQQLGRETSPTLPASTSEDNITSSSSRLRSCPAGRSRSTGPRRACTHLLDAR